MDPISCNVSEGIKILSELYDSGLSYISFNIARSEVSKLMQL